MGVVLEAIGATGVVGCEGVETDGAVDGAATRGDEGVVLVCGTVVAQGSIWRSTVSASIDSSLLT